VNVRDFGAKGDGLTDDTAAIQAAVAAIPPSGGTICFPVGTFKITENIIFPGNISAIFDRGAMLAPASGVTVTMNSEIRAGLYQIFTIGAGLIRGFSNAPFLLPEWWGAKADGVHDDGPAIQATLDAVPDQATLGAVPGLGGTIVLSSGHYISYQGFIVKAHGTTITGLRSAYSYDANPWATQVEFNAPKLSASSMTWSNANGGQVAVVLAAPQSFVQAVGDWIGISGATNSGTGGDSVVNGSFQINTITDSQHFTFLFPADPDVVAVIGGIISITFATGFDFCMGLMTSTDPNSTYAQGLRVNCKIFQLVVNGANTLLNGIRMASTNLIEEFTVYSCTNGILLDNFTNQIQINKCSAASNNVGLYTVGPGTTTWSCKQSNFRENDVGVRIECGSGVQMENCLIETNNSYGMELYAPANTIYLHHLNFTSLWLENNSYQSDDKYQLYIHCDPTQDPAISYLPMAYIRFEQCQFYTDSAKQSDINIEQAQFVTFDECLFYHSNPDPSVPYIVLGPAAVDTYFRNCVSNRVGLPADIATQGTNTVNNRRTGVAAPVSGSYSAGDIVWNSAPSPGGNVGWVCVTAGTPGEWKAFGSIAT
jgi:hypothetical protein